MKAETKIKVAEQRGFLQRSFAAFIDGHSEEALRIATTIRVLVHETERSRPLLKSVRVDYLQLPILDFPVSNPPGGGKVLVRYAIGVSISSQGVQPITDTLRMEPTTMGKWWEKSSLVFTDPQGERIEFRRRDLLLTLANMEGGAHVATSLPAKYERYVVNSGVKMIVSGAETDSIHLARFAAVEAAVQMIDCLDQILA